MSVPNGTARGPVVDTDAAPVQRPGRERRAFAHVDVADREIAKGEHRHGDERTVALVDAEQVSEHRAFASRDRGVVRGAAKHLAARAAQQR